MSLFVYKFSVSGGVEKSGKITAKTEQAARERLAKQHLIVTWHSITETKTVPRKPASSAKAGPAKSKSSTKLEKLLFLQSDKCFFCGRVLMKEEASVEHLHPKSKGGSNADDNVVTCCVTLNRAFGSMDLKQKLRIILDKAGDFTCPKS